MKCLLDGGAYAAFTGGLNDTASNCVSVGFGIALQQSTDQLQREQNAAADNDRNEIMPDVKTLQAQVKPFGDCLATARERGTKLYKIFVASTPDPKIREDAKKILAAWLTYVDSLTISRDPSANNNAQAAAVKQAESEMKVDLL